MTDFRYVEQANNEVQDFDREQGPQDLFAAIKDFSGRLGFDDAHLSVKTHRRLTELLEGASSCPAPAWWRTCGRSRSRARSCASAPPRRWSTRSTGGCSRPGSSGARSATWRSRSSTRCACAGPPVRRFPSIVASAEHGALPHAQPRDVAIVSDTLVTLDIGAVLDGYCSDCTRTWATGDVSDELAETYALVLRAQVAALDAVRPGLKGGEVDAVGRDLIAAAGHGDHFGHGLGHGVGLATHEGPRLGRGSESVLVAGNVVTVEPGVYLPGVGGVRIEDLVVVTEGGRDVLSHTTKELLTVD